MARKYTRRQAITAAVASGGYLLTGPAYNVGRVYGANDKLTVAGIGVGGKGSSDIDDAGSFMEIGRAHV